MIDLLNAITSIEPPFNMVVLIVLIATGGGVISGIANQIGIYARNHDELALKQEMLDRGMTAGEITQVMRASSSGGDLA